MFLISKIPFWKKDGQWDRAASPKALQICKENIHSQYKTIFTSFGQSTAEVYDNHILFTMICIFWLE